MTSLEIANNILPPTSTTITYARPHLTTQKLRPAVRNLRKDGRTRYSWRSVYGCSCVVIISPVVCGPDNLQPKLHLMRSELFSSLTLNFVFLVGTSGPCRGRTPQTSSCRRGREESFWWGTRPPYKVRENYCLFWLFFNCRHQEITCCVWGRTARCLITLLTRSRPEIRPGNLACWQC